MSGAPDASGMGRVVRTAVGDAGGREAAEGFGVELVAEDDAVEVAAAFGVLVPAALAAAGDATAVVRARVTFGFGFTAGSAGGNGFAVGSGGGVWSAMRLA